MEEFSSLFRDWKIVHVLVLHIADACFIVSSVSCSLSSVAHVIAGSYQGCGMMRVFLQHVFFYCCLSTCFLITCSPNLSNHRARRFDIARVQPRTTKGSVSDNPHTTDSLLVWWKLGKVALHFDPLESWNFPSYHVETRTVDVMLTDALLNINLWRELVHHFFAFAFASFSYPFVFFCGFFCTCRDNWMCWDALQKTSQNSIALKFGKNACWRSLLCRRVKNGSNMNCTARTWWSPHCRSLFRK